MAIDNDNPQGADQNIPTYDAIHEGQPVSPDMDLRQTAGQPDINNAPDQSRQALRMPTPQVQAPPQARPQARPVSYRARIFDHILSTMSPPMRVNDVDAQGNAIVREVPRSHGTLGKSIIASVLAGMLSPTADQYMSNPYGAVRIPNPMGDMAAGAQGYKNDQQAQQAKMQGRIDERTARAAQVLQNNLNTYHIATAAQNLQTEQQQKLVSDGEPMLKALREFDAQNNDATQPRFVKASGVTGQDVMEKYHTLKENAILDGYVPALDANGNQIKHNGMIQYTPTFTVIDPEAMIKLSPELKEQLSPRIPGFSKVPDGTPIKLKALLPKLHQIQYSSIAQGMFTNLGKMAEDNGAKSVDVAGLMKDPRVSAVFDQIIGLNGHDPDEVIDALRKSHDPKAQLAAGIISDKLGLNDPAVFRSFGEDRKKQQLQDKGEQAAATKDAERNSLEKGDRGFYSSVVASDKTGWKPDQATYLNRKEYNSAREKFTTPSGAFGKALDVEKSYSMMNAAYDEYKAAAAQGKQLPSGAQSMLALSTHLATTFGGVKGSRVTKDMIQHHLGARSVSDDALVGIQKFTSGDVLSPAQWAAFHDLIGQSRKFTWDGVVKTAHAQGLRRTRPA